MERQEAHAGKKIGGEIDLVNLLPSEAFQSLGDRVGADLSLGVGPSCVSVWILERDKGVGLRYFVARSTTWRR